MKGLNCSKFYSLSKDKKRRRALGMYKYVSFYQYQNKRQQQ